MINTQELKKLIKQKGFTQKDMAITLNIAQPTANQKINNIRPMTLTEAEKLSVWLEISPEHFGNYFFMK